MSRQGDILSILHLFDVETPNWTVEEIAQELGISVRTAYRNVRELVQSGFLDPISGASYVLGPAFISFDRVIRQSDPLIHIASPGMRRLLEEADQEAAVIVFRRFRDRMMSVHILEGDAPHLPPSYERGAAMSLFLGAPAKVILAFLPDRAMRALYQRHEETLRAAGVESWDNMKAQLRAIRRAGYAMTEAEVGAGRVGIAAPILRGDQVVASLSIVLAAASLHRDQNKMRRFADAVQREAKDISLLLEGQDAHAARP
ncbi:hypothetical protein GCM10007301_30030 [Azorhizobium oxalatiphilum]|uniref:IclR-ED domain-containing protein n=1 Tax=Azorhizobium oxalatiphilum TaxID=980631 RepID=A0A917FDA9_9HYPH|nr:IclR family transcriptional regulator C-terminal domain-containing protein [Azorhizobium oxalatiphilum]GGF68348.1 hypothetical protein GCM10007301_30030 [Azorhizobium oxalatiphilum]